jgi:uncharacterized protein (DUF433 family)
MKVPGFEHISVTPGLLGGKPHVEGTRISVEHVLELLSDGATPDDFATGWPEVTPEVVAEVLRYAAMAVGRERIFSGAHAG